MVPKTVDSTRMDTPLTELFDLEFPIIQAPMAGVSRRRWRRR